MTNEYFVLSCGVVVALTVAFLLAINSTGGAY